MNSSEQSGDVELNGVVQDSVDPDVVLSGYLSVDDEDDDG
jgi:hypothetical protein